MGEGQHGVRSAAEEAQEAGRLETGDLQQALQPSVGWMQRRHQGDAGRSRRDPAPLKSVRTPRRVQFRQGETPGRMAACLRREWEACLTASSRRITPDQHLKTFHQNRHRSSHTTHQTSSFTSTVIAGTCPPLLMYMTVSPSTSCGATCPSSASSRRSRSATLYLKEARDQNQRSRTLHSDLRSTQAEDCTHLHVPSGDNTAWPTVPGSTSTPPFSKKSTREPGWNLCTPGPGGAA